MLGAHITKFALQNANLRRIRLVRRLRNPEVDELHLAIVPNHDVLRANVAVNDVHRLAIGILLIMRIIEPLAHLAHNVANASDVELLIHPHATVEDDPQVVPRHVFHGNVVIAIDISKVVYLRNVCMVELHGEFRLVDEHRDELFVLGNRG